MELKEKHMLHISMKQTELIHPSYCVSVVRLNIYQAEPSPYILVHSSGGACKWFSPNYYSGIFFS